MRRADERVHPQATRGLVSQILTFCALLTTWVLLCGVEFLGLLTFVIFYRVGMKTLARARPSLAEYDMVFEMISLADSTSHCEGCCARAFSARM